MSTPLCVRSPNSQRRAGQPERKRRRQQVTGSLLCPLVSRVQTTASPWRRRRRSPGAASSLAGPGGSRASGAACPSSTRPPRPPSVRVCVPPFSDRFDVVPAVGWHRTELGPFFAVVVIAYWYRRRRHPGGHGGGRGDRGRRGAGRVLPRRREALVARPWGRARQLPPGDRRQGADLLTPQLTTTSQVCWSRERLALSLLCEQSSFWGRLGRLLCR